MAISRINKTYLDDGTTTSSSKSTPSTDITGADTIFVHVYVYDATDKISTVTDSDGNTYTLVHKEQVGNAWIYAYAATGITASSTNVVTVTLTGPERFTIFMTAYSGVDQTTPAYAADAIVTTSGTTIDVTTTNDNEYILSFLAGRSMSSFSCDGSQTDIGSFNGSYIDAMLTEEAIATAGTDTQSFTVSGGIYVGILSFAIKQQVSGSAATIVPNTADLTTFATTEPTLEFTGSDADGDDVRYQIQIDSANTFDSQGTPAVADSISETGQNTDASLSGTVLEYAVSLTGDGKYLSSVKFYLKLQGSPTGNLQARLFAAALVGEPFPAFTIGALLGVSNSTYDSSTLTGTYQMIEFTFDESILLESGQLYAISIDGWNLPGDFTDYVRAGVDNTATTYNGARNVGSRATPSWQYGSNYLLCYEAYTVVRTPLIDAVSGTDAGFANTVTPADTDPFNEGEKADYDVQPADALTDGNTYYWRVRVKDPSNWDTWSAWTTVREFDISLSGGGGSIASSISTSSSISSSLSGKGSIASSINVSSSISSALIGKVNIASSISTDSTVSGDLKAKAIGYSNVATDSTISGTLSGKGSMVVSIAVSSTVSGTIVNNNMIASVNTASTIVGSLTANGELQALINTFSTPTGTATARGNIVSDIATDTTIVGTLTSKAQIESNINTGSTTASTLTAKGELSCSVSTSSSVSSELIGKTAIASSINTLSSVSATLNGKGVISSSVSTSSTILADLTSSAVSNISSSVSTQSIVNASIIGIGNMSSEANIVDGPSFGTAQWETISGFPDTSSVANIFYSFTSVINEVSFYMKGDPTLDFDIRMSIYSVNSTDPDTELEVSPTVVSASSVSSIGEWITFSFNGNLYNGDIAIVVWIDNVVYLGSRNKLQIRCENDKKKTQIIGRVSQQFGWTFTDKVFNYDVNVSQSFIRAIGNLTKKVAISGSINTSSTVSGTLMAKGELNAGINTGSTVVATLGYNIKNLCYFDIQYIEKTYECNYVDVLNEIKYLEIVYETAYIEQTVNVLEYVEKIYEIDIVCKK